MIVYYNGEFLPKEKVNIPISSAGFQYGFGFFTTLKYTEEKFWYLSDHIQRLSTSLNTFGMEKLTINFKKNLKLLIEKNSLNDARIKIMAFKNRGTSVLIIPQPLIINQAPKALVCQLSNRGNNQFYRHKSMNYLENIHDKDVLQATAFDDYLYYDSAGNVLEATTSNIFFIKDKQLYTPDLKLPILNGIIRKQLISKNTVIQKRLKIETLEQFDSCFLTNSIHEMVPIKSICYIGNTIHFNHEKLEISLLH